jgi:ribosomal protein S18 acetylase RimI-like enzyme
MDALRLERAAARGWPASEVEEAGGWLLRATPELQRARSNGALPLVADPEVDLLEAWYAARGRRAGVQVAPLERHGALDDRLAARGYVADYEVDVLTAPAADVPAPAEPVALLSAPSARWLDAWARAEEREDTAAHARTVLAAVTGRAAFALAPRGLGVGLAVRDPEEPVAGLFCLATARAARGQGVGTAVLRALAEWAAGEGGELLYLQVGRRNPAQALYRRHGFTRSHGYHHRTSPAVLPRPPAAGPEGLRSPEPHSATKGRAVS